MNKDIKRLLILFVTLTLISTIVILIKGRTYTLAYNIRNNTYETFIEDNNNNIKILNEKKDKNNYYIKVKALKPGRVFIGVGDDESKTMNVLYIHKTLIITNENYFGKSTGSEIIPISITVLLIYSIYILIKRYKKHVKENLYQYRNIAYLGIIIFLALFTIENFLTIFNYYGMSETISKIIRSMSSVSMFLFPIALITFILVTISNILLIKKEGKSLRNLLGLFLGIFICISTWIPDFTYQILQKSQTINIFNLNSPGPYIYNFIESLIYLVIGYLECVLIGTIIIAIKSVRKRIEYNKDYIIILGCQIKKDGTLTPLLKGRVDKALDFRNKQLKENGQDLLFITSGGKGNDEIISEADAMKNYLLEKGIKEKNILIENKSKNTYENIKNSYNLIKNKKANIAFSTTNYHVLRAGLIATEQGIIMDGLGSKTKTYFWINAFIREFIGTLYTERKKHILVFIFVIIILILMIGITYLANNI